MENYSGSQIVQRETIRFASVKLTEEAKKRVLESLPDAVTSAATGAIDYERRLDNIEILVDCWGENYLAYLRDNEIGIIKPLAECFFFPLEWEGVISGEEDTPNFNFDANCMEGALYDLDMRIRFGYADLIRSINEYYYEIPDFAWLQASHDEDHPAVPISMAAEMIGVSESRVKKMVQDGVLDGYKRDGRVYVYEEAIEKRMAFLEVFGRPTRGKAIKRGKGNG